MPYKDIKLTFIGGRKCIINPGSIKGMIEFSDETMISIIIGMEYYPREIIVEEKIDDIQKLFELISEEEYWKNKVYYGDGLLVEYTNFDELK